MLKGHRSFSQGGSVGEDNTTVNLQHHNAVQKVNLFLRGTRKGTFRRDKYECSETTRRQEQPHMAYYAQ